MAPCSKLQALVYDILPLEEGAGKPAMLGESSYPPPPPILRKTNRTEVVPSASGPVLQTPSTGLRHPSFGGRCRKAGDARRESSYPPPPPPHPQENKQDGGGPLTKWPRAPNSKHWFTTSFLWRKVPESDAQREPPPPPPPHILRKTNRTEVVPSVSDSVLIRNAAHLLAYLLHARRGLCGNVLSSRYPFSL